MELIVACTENGIIGDGISLPWHIPEDLKRFKQLTTDHIIVMGRKTYDSLPVYPLPNRINVVISNVDTPIVSPNLYIANESDARTILGYLRDLHPSKKIYIIGGSKIYTMFFYDCNIFHITLVNGCGVYEPKSPVIFRGLTYLRENPEMYREVYRGNATVSRNSNFIYTYITYQTICETTKDIHKQT